MSIAEIERFAADVGSNPALRAEFEACAKGSKTGPLDGLTALAATKGYSFTADELTEHAKAKTAGKNLTDGELDGVVGGFINNGAGSDFIGTLVLLFQLADAYSGRGTSST